MNEKHQRIIREKRLKDRLMREQKARNLTNLKAAEAAEAGRSVAPCVTVPEHVADAGCQPGCDDPNCKDAQ